MTYLKKTLLLSSVFVLTSCVTASDSVKYWGCEYLPKSKVQKYNKNTHRFFVNDEKLSKYGVYHKDLRLRICSARPDSPLQAKKEVRVHTPGYYGYDGYTHCVHRPNETSVQIYQIFIDWAKQPYTVREQTLLQTNEKIKSLKCVVSGTRNTQVKASEADWYVENEAQTQTPVLVSNARESVALNYAFTNRTIAIEVDTAQRILNTVQVYFNDDSINVETTPFEGEFKRFIKTMTSF